MFENFRLKRVVIKAYDKSIDQGKLYAEYKTKKNWQYREIVQNKPNGLENFKRSIDSQSSIIYKGLSLISDNSNVTFLSSEINLLKSKLNGLIITLNAQKKAAESGNLKRLEELLREEREKMVLVTRYLYFVNSGIESKFKIIKIKREEVSVFLLRWMVFIVLDAMISSNTKFNDWNNLIIIIIRTGLINTGISIVNLVMKKI